MIVGFGECAKREGLMVVFKCRTECNIMNECMNKYINEDKFQEYVREKWALKESSKKL